MTTTINLLPWREKLRAQQKRNFLISCAGAAVIALVFNGIWYGILQSRINHQQARNNVLQQEVQQADAVIIQKKKAEADKKDLSAQMATLTELHNQRYRIVELLDTLPKILPNSVYITQITIGKTSIELLGFGPSSIQVSEFTKRLNQQPGWSKVQLKEITTLAHEPNKALFKITLTLV